MACCTRLGGTKRSLLRVLYRVRHSKRPTRPPTHLGNLVWVSGNIYAQDWLNLAMYGSLIHIQGPLPSSDSNAAPSRFGGPEGRVTNWREPYAARVTVSQQCECMRARPTMWAVRAQALAWSAPRHWAAGRRAKALQRK